MAVPDGVDLHDAVLDARLGVLDERRRWDGEKLRHEVQQERWEREKAFYLRGGYTGDDAAVDADGAAEAAVMRTDVLKAMAALSTDERKLELVRLQVCEEEERQTAECEAAEGAWDLLNALECTLQAQHQHDLIKEADTYAAHAASLTHAVAALAASIEHQRARLDYWEREEACLASRTELQRDAAPPGPPLPPPSPPRFTAAASPPVALQTHAPPLESRGRYRADLMSPMSPEMEQEMEREMKAAARELDVARPYVPSPAPGEGLRAPSPHRVVVVHADEARAAVGVHGPLSATVPVGAVEGGGDEDPAAMVTLIGDLAGGFSENTTSPPDTARGGCEDDSALGAAAPAPAPAAWEAAVRSKEREAWAVRRAVAREKLRQKRRSASRARQASEASVGTAATSYREWYHTHTHTETPCTAPVPVPSPSVAKPPPALTLRLLSAPLGGHCVKGERMTSPPPYHAVPEPVLAASRSPTAYESMSPRWRPVYGGSELPDARTSTAASMPGGATRSPTPNLAAGGRLPSPPPTSPRLPAPESYELKAGQTVTVRVEAWGVPDAPIALSTAGTLEVRLPAGVDSVRALQRGATEWVDVAVLGGAGHLIAFYPQYGAHPASHRSVAVHVAAAPEGVPGTAVEAALSVTPCRQLADDAEPAAPACLYQYWSTHPAGSAPVAVVGWEAQAAAPAVPTAASADARASPSVMSVSSMDGEGEVGAAADADPAAASNARMAALMQAGDRALRDSVDDVLRRHGVLPTAAAEEDNESDGHSPAETVINIAPAVLPPPIDETQAAEAVRGRGVALHTGRSGELWAAAADGGAVRIMECGREGFAHRMTLEAELGAEGGDRPSPVRGVLWMSRYVAVVTGGDEVLLWEHRFINAWLAFKASLPRGTVRHTMPFKAADARGVAVYRDAQDDKDEELIVAPRGHSAFLPDGAGGSHVYLRAWAPRASRTATLAGVGAPHQPLDVLDVAIPDRVADDVVQVAAVYPYVFVAWRSGVACWAPAETGIYDVDRPSISPLRPRGPGIPPGPAPHAHTSPHRYAPTAADAVPPSPDGGVPEWAKGRVRPGETRVVAAAATLSRSASITCVAAAAALLQPGWVAAVGSACGGVWLSLPSRGQGEAAPGGMCQQQFARCSGAVVDVAFTAQGRVLVCGTARAVAVYDVERRAVMQTFTGGGCRAVAAVGAAAGPAVFDQRRQWWGNVPAILDAQGVPQSPPRHHSTAPPAHLAGLSLTVMAETGGVPDVHTLNVPAAAAVASPREEPRAHSASSPENPVPGEEAPREAEAEAEAVLPPPRGYVCTMSTPAAHRSLLSPTRAGSEAPPGFVGLRAKDTAPPGGGVTVVAVTDPGPAAAAGLRPGDVIVGFGDAPIRVGRDFAAAAKAAPAGKDVRVCYLRDGEVAETALAVQPRPWTPSSQSLPDPAPPPPAAAAEAPKPAPPQQLPLRRGGVGSGVLHGAEAAEAAAHHSDTDGEDYPTPQELSCSGGSAAASSAPSLSEDSEDEATRGTRRAASGSSSSIPTYASPSIASASAAELPPAQHALPPASAAAPLQRARRVRKVPDMTPLPKARPAAGRDGSTSTAHGGVIFRKDHPRPAHRARSGSAASSGSDAPRSALKRRGRVASGTSAPSTVPQAPYADPSQGYSTSEGDALHATTTTTATTTDEEPVVASFDGATGRGMPVVPSGAATTTAAATSSPESLGLPMRRTLTGGSVTSGEAPPRQPRVAFSTKVKKPRSRAASSQPTRSPSAEPRPRRHVSTSPAPPAASGSGHDPALAGFTAEEQRNLSTATFGGTTPFARYHGLLLANRQPLPTPQTEITMRKAAVAFLQKRKRKKEPYVNWWKLTRPPSRR